ncbi:MAG: inner membrane protein YhjD [Pantoea sp.]|nr:inner membrane protein YhjD [Pantoea sp.]
MTDKQENPTSSEQPKPLIDIQTGNKTVDGSIRRVSRFAAWFQAIPAVAHFIRALERFNDRLGSQFGAAITYFSFLSLIGINWMGNLREAVRAQSRDVWERKPDDQEKFWKKYLRDLISLIGLMLALVITLSLTSIAGAAQAAIVNALGLADIEWLRPAMTAIALTISIMANYLLFLWIFWILPRHKPRKKALFRGTLLAAIGFEIIKFVMTLTLPKLASSPSGAAFGSVLGLMAFFYFFARLTLFCAAWIATAKYKDDPQMPDSRRASRHQV